MVLSAGVHDPHRLPWLVTQRTDAGRARPSRCLRARSRRAGHQLVVAGPQPGVLAGQPLEHDRHPAAFLRPAHPGRDQDDGAVALAVGGDRAPAAGAAADLDRRGEQRLVLAGRQAVPTRPGAGSRGQPSSHARNASDFLPSTAGGQRLPRSAAGCAMVHMSVHRTVDGFSTPTTGAVPRFGPRPAQLAARLSTGRRTDHGQAVDDLRRTLLASPTTKPPGRAAGRFARGRRTVRPSGPGAS